MADSLLALDVGDASIEALLLEGGSHVRFYQRVELSDGVVMDGAIVNEEKFISALTSLAEGCKKQIGGLRRGLLPTALNFPESKIFIYCFDVGLIAGSDREKIIRAEAEKIIPWQEQEIYFDFIAKKDKETNHVLYVAAPKKLVNDYQRACASAGFDLVAIGAESLSLGQALLSAGEPHGATLILDIGARTTNISIFDKDDLLALSVSVPIAGQIFSQAIARDKGLSLPEAEALKRKGENLCTPDISTAYPSLFSSFEELAQEVQKAVVYFEKKTKEIVTAVVLAGGSSLLIGFDVFWGNKLGRKTSIGDPLKKVSNPDALHDGGAAIFFADVIGLALSARDSKAEQINLLRRATLPDKISGSRSGVDLKIMFHRFFSRGKK